MEMVGRFFLMAGCYRTHGFPQVNPLVPTTTQRDVLAVFCVFASGEDEYWRKYCDVVQGRYITGKPMLHLSVDSLISRCCETWSGALPMCSCGPM